MTLSPKLKAYEDAFDVLNEMYFESALSKPVITIYPEPGTYGHFTPWKSWNDEGVERYEINLAATEVDRPLTDVMCTLLHEMVHQYCTENGIKDTSRGNCYHNKKFKAECEKRGLKVSHDRACGWGVTDPGPAFTDFIEQSKRFEPCRIQLCRVGGGREAQTGSGTGKKPSSTRKDVCPKCGMSVRATKEVNIGCLDCNEKMEEV